MRTSFIKFGRTLLLVAGIGAVAWSCADRQNDPALTGPPAPSEASQNASVQNGSGNPLAHIGIMHNQAMDQVARDLRHAAKKKGAMLTREETFVVLEASLDKFYRTRGVGMLSAAEARSWREFLQARPNASARDLLREIAVVTTSETEIVLSPRAQEYVDQIALLADEVGMYGSVAWLQQQLATLEQSAAQELSGTDLDAVYATSAVAVSSAEYWPTNAEAWYAMCGEDIYCAGPGGGPGGGSPDMPQIERINGWKVLGADVIGAAGGFLRGGWPGAAVGAAVTSSVAVIMQL